MEADTSSDNSVKVTKQLYHDISTAQVMPSEDWTYTMRRTMQEIVPGVYLGPYASAGKKKFEDLKSAGITHVICVRQEIEKNFIRPNFESEFCYLVVTLADNFLETIIPKIKETKEFIDNCLGTGGKVLVHCNDGMSRAPALVIAYIMETYGIDFSSALNHVQQRRFCVQPNDGFEQQLREFEPIYRARVELGAKEGERGEGKREREEESDDETDMDSGGTVIKCRVQDNRNEGMDL